VSGPDADPDVDGYTNRLEFALSGNPLVHSDRAPTARFEQIGDNTYATLEFVRRTTVEGLSVTVQFGDDLAGWTTPAVLISNTAESGGLRREIWRSALSVSTARRLFGRVLVSDP
jgi:DNA-directed RNA polymerase beta' subunit